MYCPKCAAKTSEHFTFCNNCGYNISAKNMPPLKEPSDPHIIHKPYKAAYILGIVGSILITFLIFISLVIYQALDLFFLSVHISFNFIIIFALCSASNLAGTLLLIKEKHIGMIFYFLSALLPTVLYFIYLPSGFASLLFTPLMLAAGITALIRKNQLVKYYNQPYTR